MPTTANIYIDGEILPESYIWEGENATSLHRVREQVRVAMAAGAVDKLKLHIFSPGGYCLEGWAIVDYLLSLALPIDTLAYGQCASFGTVLHTLGAVRETSPHCDYVVHRPWDFFMGNDLQIAEANASLMKETAKLFAHYALTTGHTTDELAALIGKDDVKWTPQETVDHGFSTAIFQPGASASVRLRTGSLQKPSYLMSLGDRKPNPKYIPDAKPKPTTMATVKQTLKDAATSVLAFLNGEQPKALDTPLKDGGTINTDSTGDTIVVGDTTTAADGEYVTEDDMTITVAGGVVTAIAEPTTDEADTTETSADPADATATADTVAALVAASAKKDADYKALSDKFDRLESSVRPILAGMISADPITKANITPDSNKESNPESDREKMLAEHAAKYAKK